MQIEDQSVLITNALDGSQGAFAKLLGMYWADVYNFLLSKELCEQDAEDLCIETFSKAFEKLYTYNTEYKFKTWLITIASNSYIDFLRKNNRLLSLFSRPGMLNEDFESKHDVAVYHNPESDMIQTQAMESFVLCMNHLKPQYRQVLQMRYIDDKSINEISESMNISVSNVKVILMRGRRILEKNIE